MAGERLFVSSDGLDAGAGRCDDASASASSGAKILQSVAVESGIFGDFDAAHSFHRVASEVHAYHVDKFNGHADDLTSLGGKGERAADWFTRDDETSADAIGLQM
ncbi:DUF2563 family protein [Mycolicibacterium sp. J2]|uniref:DUF2563 family protein n=1 Tax=Mycolicibacterium sp. J2 TaxID=2993511 RepID=UPI00224B6010|nr:DUF2563 family protein [Mycolicibacterium sp. J2]MCX2712621.1 DUF2563 family protein [Mycolicibacterium sp. J2]